MPGHYKNPYGYSYHNPTGKEQAALTIGSLLSGVLAASGGQSKGDAIRRGLAGTMAGYGSGYQNYQNLMGDAFTRDLQNKNYNQDLKSYDQRIKEYEESEKPFREAVTNYYNQRESKPIDYNKIRDERTLRRLDIKRKQKELAEVKHIGNYGKLQGQLAALQSPQNMDYMGLPEDERQRQIAIAKNSLRIMEKQYPDLIMPQQGAQPTTQRTDDAMQRYNADPEMQGTTIGKRTDKGYEVFKNGKPIGHYQ